MEIKKLFYPFLIIFLITFLIINWNKISFIFNYKVIFGFISDFFQRANPVTVFNSLNLNQSRLIKFEYSDKENSLEIPKIKVLAPLIFVESSDEKTLENALDRGVVHFPDSVLPGEIGQTIILGHSAPPNWPKIKYDWVFNYLNELTQGDEIFVYFNHKKFTYYVTKNFFLKKGEEPPKGDSLKNTLILISCWPPGKDLNRIAVEAISR